MSQSPCEPSGSRRGPDAAGRDRDDRRRLGASRRVDAGTESPSVRHGVGKRADV